MSIDLQVKVACGLKLHDIPSPCVNRLPGQQHPLLVESCRLYGFYFPVTWFRGRNPVKSLWHLDLSQPKIHARFVLFRWVLRAFLLLRQNGWSHPDGEQAYAMDVEMCGTDDSGDEALKLLGWRFLFYVHKESPVTLGEVLVRLLGTYCEKSQRPVSEAWEALGLDEAGMQDDGDDNGSVASTASSRKRRRPASSRPKPKVRPEVLNDPCHSQNPRNCPESQLDSMHQLSRLVALHACVAFDRVQSLLNKYRVNHILHPLQPESIFGPDVFCMAENSVDMCPSQSTVSMYGQLRPEVELLRRECLAVEAEAWAEAQSARRAGELVDADALHARVWRETQQLQDDFTHGEGVFGANGSHGLGLEHTDLSPWGRHTVPRADRVWHWRHVGDEASVLESGLPDFSATRGALLQSAGCFDFCKAGTRDLNSMGDFATVAAAGALEDAAGSDDDDEDSTGRSRFNPFALMSRDPREVFVKTQGVGQARAGRLTLEEVAAHNKAMREALEARAHAYVKRRGWTSDSEEHQRLRHEEYARVLEHFRAEAQRFHDENVWHADAARSDAVRSIIRWGDAYLREHKGVLARPRRAVHGNLSMLQEWDLAFYEVAEKLVKASSCHAQMLLSYLSALNSTDPDRTCKLHLLGVGEAGISKSFVEKEVNEFCIPATCQDMTYMTKRAMAANGDSDGATIQMHEASYNLLGVGKLTDEEAAIKQQLTSGHCAGVELVFDPETGERKQRGFYRKTNICFHMITNAALNQISEPVRSRCHVILYQNRPRPGRGMRDVMCYNSTPKMKRWVEAARVEYRWMQYMVAYVHSLMEGGVLDSPDRSYTAQMVPVIGKEAARLQVPNHDMPRPMARLFKMVELRTVIRAVLQVFGDPQSPFGQTGVKFRPAHFLAVSGHLSDAAEPNILVSSMGLLRSEWENPVREQILTTLRDEVYLKIKDLPQLTDQEDDDQLMVAAADAAEAAIGHAYVDTQDVQHVIVDDLDMVVLEADASAKDVLWPSDEESQEESEQKAAPSEDGADFCPEQWWRDVQREAEDAPNDEDLSEVDWAQAIREQKDRDLLQTRALAENRAFQRSQSMAQVQKISKVLDQEIFRPSAKSLQGSHCLMRPRVKNGTAVVLSDSPRGGSGNHGEGQDLGDVQFKRTLDQITLDLQNSMHARHDNRHVRDALLELTKQPVDGSHCSAPALVLTNGEACLHRQLVIHSAGSQQSSPRLERALLAAMEHQSSRMLTFFFGTPMWHDHPNEFRVVQIARNPRNPLEITDLDQGTEYESELLGEQIIDLDKDDLRKTFSELTNSEDKKRGFRRAGKVLNVEDTLYERFLIEKRVSREAVNRFNYRSGYHLMVQRRAQRTLEIKRHAKLLVYLDEQKENAQFSAEQRALLEDPPQPLLEFPECARHSQNNLARQEGAVQEPAVEASWKKRLQKRKYARQAAIDKYQAYVSGQGGDSHQFVSAPLRPEARANRRIEPSKASEEYAILFHDK